MSEKREPRKHLLKRILLIILVIIAALAAAFLIYTGRYYHAGALAKAYIAGSNMPVTMGSADVTVTEESGGWLFDGPGTDTAIVFYPEAKVQAESYAPVLYLTAQTGYDCFLVNMPFRLAVFGINKADDVIRSHPEYDSWYIAGHSLGGAMAGAFAADHMAELDGVIFMAAYPTESLDSDGFRALSLYGSEDGVLNRERYEEGKAFMPADFTEVVIDGGNHAQFGDYGNQKGDGEAAIDPEEQWLQTVIAIDEFMEKIP